MAHERTYKMLKPSARPSKFQSDQVAVIKGMRLRGDSQHDIATWFGVNQGRVNEALVMHEKRWMNVPPALPHELPPPPPYVVVSKVEYQTVSDAAAVPLRVLEDINRKLYAIMESIDGASTRENQGSANARALLGASGDRGAEARSSGRTVRAASTNLQ